MTLAYDAREETARVRVISVQEPYVELAVIASDAPGLLAKICATFSAARFKVVSAQIYSWSNPDGSERVLDLFWVRAGNDSAQAQRAVPGVQTELRRLLAGEISADDLVPSRGQEMRWNSRPAPKIEARVNIDSRSATNHTIVEVVTRDRRDLLYRLSRAISECGLSIYLAKINTEGDRVADVFYVCKPGGSKVTEQAEMAALEQRLLQTIADLEGSALVVEPAVPVESEH
jgi:[protein-PII] uridylyltransferase